MPSADTLVTGFELQFKTGGWSLTAEAELGWTVAEYRGGIISELLELTTNTFSLLATRRLSEDDESIFSLNPTGTGPGYPQPAGCTKGVESYISRELTPSGRQLDLTASWHREGLLGPEESVLGRVPDRGSTIERSGTYRERAYLQSGSRLTDRLLNLFQKAHT